MSGQSSQCSSARDGEAGGLPCNGSTGLIDEEDFLLVNSGIQKLLIDDFGNPTSA